MKTTKHIRYLCADTEKELHQWVTGIRVAKNAKQLYANYRGIEDDITHADIDILTSKRFSLNSPNNLQINGNTAGSTTGSSCQTKTSSTASPARTPSSENKSLDSALSSGIVSDVSTSNDNEVVSVSPLPVDELTPVNTMDRHHLAAGRGGHLQRSSSKVSTSSSSSGCLSDRGSSSAGSMQQQQQQQQRNGFESDHPVGGTIKKRPSAMANPKLPLTNTTFGLVRDSDEGEGDSSSLGSGDNIRVGGGGTLLRSAVRQSLRRNSKPQLQEQPHPQQQVQVQIHQVASQENPMVNDTLSQGCEAALNSIGIEPEDKMDEDMPLPPPPRAESIAMNMTMATQGHNMDTVTCLPEEEIDDLPPPPPEIYNNQLQMQLKQQQQQQQRQKKVPPPPPPVANKPGKTTKRISFDDNVQLIGISEPDPGQHHIYSFQRPEYVANPKKLFSQESKNDAVPPRTFLTDLQKVITKKWQIGKMDNKQPRLQ